MQQLLDIVERVIIPVAFTETDAVLVETLAIFSKGFCTSFINCHNDAIILNSCLN